MILHKYIQKRKLAEKIPTYHNIQWDKELKQQFDDICREIEIDIALGELSTVFHKQLEDGLTK